MAPFVTTFNCLTTDPCPLIAWPYRRPIDQADFFFVWGWGNFFLGRVGTGFDAELVFEAIERTALGAARPNRSADRTHKYDGK